MFTHNLKYFLKIIFRNKILIFWTFAFPIILGTFFYMAFSGLKNNTKLDIINIAIIKNDDFNNNEIFKSVFKELSDENNENRLFKTSYVTEDEAKKLLEDKKIIGYLKLINETPKLTFKKNGIQETVFKCVVEEIVQKTDIFKNLLNEIKKEFKVNNYIDIYNKVAKISKEGDVKLNNISNKNLTFMMIEFYTLIAMSCLYGGVIGIVVINQCLANMSNQGKRISISSISKGKIILSSVIASYIVQIIGLILLFIYTIFILKVDFGNRLGLSIILGMVGSLAGLSLGIVIGSTVKLNENSKIGIIIALTMLGSFLSGMMGVTMKYIIDKNVPIINKLNPANMITDGFYSLYYYDTLDRYVFNLVSLLVFSFILITISYISLRREKYDSI